MYTLLLLDEMVYGCQLYPLDSVAEFNYCHILGQHFGPEPKEITLKPKSFWSSLNLPRLDSLIKP